MSGSRKLWIRFEKSGKLADYLTFCEERRRERAALPEGSPMVSADDEKDQSSL